MPNRKPIILLVEDDEADVLLLGEAIKRARGETFTMEVITDFFDVLQRAKAHPEPALILVDDRLGQAKSGRELVEMLERDDDVTAMVRIYTGQTRSPMDLDKNDIAGTVLPLVQEALEPRKNTPDSNWRHIDRGLKDLALTKAAMSTGFEVVHTDVGRLRSELRDAMVGLTEAVQSAEPRWPATVKLAIVGLSSLIVVGLIIVFLAWGMDVDRLNAQYRGLVVNVNSEDVQGSPMDARIESDGTDYEFDFPRPPQPTE